MAELSTLARPYAKAAFDYACEHDVLGDWEEFLLALSYFVKEDEVKRLLSNPTISAKQKTSTLIDLYNALVDKLDDNSSGDDVSGLKKILSKLASAQHGASSLVAGLVGGSTSTKKASPALVNFVSQLAQFDRLALMPEIYQHYHQYQAKVLKQADAYITTAYPLTEIQKTLIQTKLAASLNATVIIHETVDPSLIAGVTIKVGDKIVDDTVRGKLKQLRTQLMT